MTWILNPEKIPEPVRYAHSLGRGMLIPQQIAELVKAINPAYVETKQKLTYLAQHQARAEMNRIFGYGNWDVDADEPVMLYEKQMLKGGGDPQYPKSGTAAEYWVVGYRIRVKVTMRDLWGMEVATYTGVHAEENAPQPNRGEAHALALTSVDSYALRRALINLGDRFGLGLYDKGSTAPHGQYTIQQPGNPQSGPGALYTWEDNGQQNVYQGAPAAQVEPEQLPHPTVSSDPTDYDDGSPQAAMATENRQRQTAAQKRMETFNGVQQTMQANREQAKAAVSPQMQARLQQGMNLDPNFDGAGVGEA